MTLGNWMETPHCLLSYQTKNKIVTVPEKHPIAAFDLTADRPTCMLLLGKTSNLNFSYDIFFISDTA